LDEKLISKIQFEISQIDKLLNNSNPLFDLCRNNEPDFIEMSAAAMVLHSFYNGIENILVLFSKYYETELSTTYKWHQELLENAFLCCKNRKPLLSSELQAQLEEYLKFRHFVRHSYGFQLEWERMEDLILKVESVWTKIKHNLQSFM
jgi:hypothetical protein